EIGDWAEDGDYYWSLASGGYGMPINFTTVSYSEGLCSQDPMAPELCFQAQSSGCGGGGGNGEPGGASQNGGGGGSGATPSNDFGTAKASMFQAALGIATVFSNPVNPKCGG